MPQYSLPWKPKTRNSLYILLPSASCFLLSAFYVFNDNAHMRVAIDFLKWWYLPETQLEFAKGGGNPSVKATLQMPGFDDIQPWFRAMKYMLNQERSRDFWHEPKYAELLVVQQDAFRAYVTGQIDDPVLAIEYAACQQQKILFESGKSKIPPPPSCTSISLR